MDDTDAAVDGWGQPVDAAIRGHQHIGIEGDFECPVDAGGEKWAQPQTMPGGKLPALCGDLSPLPCHLLVLQDDVWQPDHGGGHPQLLDVVVFLGVPAQTIISPLLGGGEMRRRGHAAPQDERDCELPVLCCPQKELIWACPQKRAQVLVPDPRGVPP